MQIQNVLFRAERMKDMSMKRVMSMETHIYHKLHCHHARRIQEKNKMMMDLKAAKSYGYKPCKCCNGMNFSYNDEINSIDYFEKKKGMQFNYKDGVLYVKTNIGCWKLVYSRGMELFALYHRNRSEKEVDFVNPEHEHYHLQKDQAYLSSINAVLNYIYNHDKYREAEQQGCKMIVFSNKKYQKQAEKRKQRQQKNRVDCLFRILESQNEGYKQLSYC